MISLNFRSEIDRDSEQIYTAAFNAIHSARMDGQKSGKHSPESWKEETIDNQLEHAANHIMNMEPRKGFNIHEAEHALCRLAIAIALYRKEYAG